LVMASILVKMRVAPCVPFKTLAMAYFLIWMFLAFHVFFGTLAMTYILVKMCLSPHVLFGTLVMVYIPFKTCMALTMVNILIKWYLAHNNILMFLLKHKSKSIMPFK
jgi:hypothetical protein